MKDSNDLTNDEHYFLDELISSVWQESGQLGAVPSGRALPPQRMVSIARLINLRKFPSPATMASDAEADHAAGKMILALAERGVKLRGARWLGGREFYFWLVDVFLHRRVRADVSAKRPEDFFFTEMETNGIDNIFRSVERFVGGLFALATPPPARWLYRFDRSSLAYLRAWQQSFLSVRTLELRPLKVYDLSEPHTVAVDFALSYRATLENRSQEEFGDRGKAVLRLRGKDWRLVSLEFSGFKFPR